MIRDLRSRGFTQIDTEVRFKPGAFGYGKTRFADIVSKNAVTSDTEIVQIGRTLKSDPDVPVIRERRALDDIIFSPDMKQYPNATIRFVDKYSPGVIQP